MSILASLVAQVVEMKALDERVLDLLNSVKQPLRETDIRSRLQVTPTLAALRETLTQMVSEGKLRLNHRKAKQPTYSIVPKP